MPGSGNPGRRLLLIGRHTSGETSILRAPALGGGFGILRISLFPTHLPASRRRPSRSVYRGRPIRLDFTTRYGRFLARRRRPAAGTLGPTVADLAQPPTGRQSAQPVADQGRKDIPAWISLVSHRRIPGPGRTIESRTTAGPARVLLLRSLGPLRLGRVEHRRYSVSGACSAVRSIRTRRCGTSSLTCPTPSCAKHIACRASSCAAGGRVDAI